ncbi:hypothetical protein PUNSTDRAFT_50390 [Punctularia strigosozonata HHB-11173 SS5]|uniref:uncharacterized protein n=1 Tax=Punctularia strigosozonata (strain HHB-11173) TaxID=741275 RepID=UPI0004418453|nr:uncharacterized protein PUNSTDRAFT_50390 [Punctularia strigosozonata HHB-11173 SS5]EIN11376.1 hypothetical protein PUNSTDRAFT_50390 [Punctularia strigosozonata HHB-11173 SS5]
MWLYLAAFSAAGFTWYKFGAEPTTASSSITRWLTKLQVPEEIWVKRNEQHLLMSTQNAEDIQLTRDAKLPSVHRYWGPMSIGQCSPHGRPVGMSVDHSDVRVKAERE